MQPLPSYVLSVQVVMTIGSQSGQYRPLVVTECCELGSIRVLVPSLKETQVPQDPAGKLLLFFSDKWEVDQVSLGTLSPFILCKRTFEICSICTYTGV